MERIKKLISELNEVAEKLENAQKETDKVMNDTDYYKCKARERDLCDELSSITDSLSYTLALYNK